MNPIHIVLTRSRAFSKEEVRIDMEGGSAEERNRVLEMAEIAVLNDWVPEEEQENAEEEEEANEQNC